MLLAVLAMHLVRLSGPDGQEIIVNKDQVVTVRTPRNIEGHFHKDVKCIIHLADGKFVAVVEPCDIVRQLLEEDAD